MNPDVYVMYEVLVQWAGMEKVYKMLFYLLVKLSLLVCYAAS